MKYEIWQLKSKEVVRAYGWDSYEKNRDRFNKDDYHCVYKGDLNVHDDYCDFLKLCDDLFMRFNVGVYPDDYKGHSMSVTDVIVFPNTNAAYYVDEFGFTDVSYSFLGKHAKFINVVYSVLRDENWDPDSSTNINQYNRIYHDNILLHHSIIHDLERCSKEIIDELRDDGDVVLKSGDIIMFPSMRDKPMMYQIDNDLDIVRQINVDDTGEMKYTEDICYVNFV